MNIYSNFKPTYLYVKRHNITGLQYFGKTINDPYKYKGSGKRWLNHLKAHGNNVTTIIIGYYTDESECIHSALQYSIENNIVESNCWANIILENGINGGGTAKQMHTEQSREKAKSTCMLKYSVEHPSMDKDIKDRAIKTYISNHGKLCAPMNSLQSIEQRNNTNFEKYGNACAANKDGNQNSKKSQLLLRSRPIIIEIKLHAFQKKVSLPLNWIYKDDTWLENKLQELLLTPIPFQIIDISNTRQLLLLRPSVTRLMELSHVFNIKLGKNWFQKSDQTIKVMLSEVLLTVADIPLPTSIQYLKEMI